MSRLDRRSNHPVDPLGGPGWLTRAWSGIRRVFSSPETLALVILFLGMVAFAVDVARRILFPR